MRDNDKPLWTCPRCGHRFVTLNMWHSCGRYSLQDHFAGKDPLVRRLFQRFRKLVRTCGPVTVYAQKTRIVFQTRARFAGCVTRQRWLDCALWLKRRVQHPRFRRIESPTPRDHVHHFRLTKIEELDDDALMKFIREAYQVGCQQGRVPTPNEKAPSTDRRTQRRQLESRD